MRIRATGGNSFGTDEDKDGAEEVVGINEKKNKVLALQKDLLQQVLICPLYIFHNNDGFII